MSGTGETFAFQLLKLIFWGEAIPNVAINAISGPLTTLYAALHTADPSEDDDQTSNEAAYPGYARVAVARTSGGWEILGGSPRIVRPNVDILFPIASGGSETETFWSVGDTISGSGLVLYSGPLSPTQSVALGVRPRIKAASTITMN